MLRRLGDDPRSPLLALILAAAIPILLFGGWVAYRSATQARDTARLGATEIAARVAERVEAELGAQLEAAGALAASTALDRPDLASFYVEAQRLKADHPLWHTIELTDPSGAQVLNLLRPVGDPLGPTVDRESFERVVRTRQPAIGGIGPVGPISRMRLVALRVPVIREGELRYVLSVALAPVSVSAILRAAGAPSGWIGAIVDARGNIIARTQAEDREQGRPASPVTREAVTRSPTAGGFYEGPTLEGINTETVFRVLPRTGGWSVHLGVPKETLDGPVRRSLYVLAAGGLASLALGAGLAFLTAQDVARRRRAEAARSATVLRASEERGALAVEAAELGTWRWDRGRNLVLGSARCCALLGLAPDASGDDADCAWPPRRVVEAVLPADRPALVAAMAVTSAGCARPAAPSARAPGHPRACTA
jgi:PAS domain-containing protein